MPSLSSSFQNIPQQLRYTLGSSLMRSLLTLLLLTTSATCFAEERDFSLLVDSWRKECKDGSCNLTLIKNIKGAKSDSDWFALGLNVSSEGAPNYFVFSYPPTSSPSQVVLSFVTLEKLTTGFKPTVREIASFTTQPCAVRKDCKVRFDAAVIPENRAGSFREVNVWQALHARNLLDVQQTYLLDGERLDRQMLVALPAFQNIAREFIGK